MDALVTDVHIAAAVAGVRALGRTGLDVAGLAPRRWAAGLRSRHAARAIGPDSVIDPDGFIDAVRDVIERHGLARRLPARTRHSTRSWARRACMDAVLPYPGPEPLAALRDKGRLADLAATAGLATAGPPPAPRASFYRPICLTARSSSRASWAGRSRTCG